MASTLSSLLSIGPNLSRQKSKSHEEIRDNAAKEGGAAAAASSSLAAPQDAKSMHHSASVHGNLDASASEAKEEGERQQERGGAATEALSPLAKITRGIQVHGIVDKGNFFPERLLHNRSEP